MCSRCIIESDVYMDTCIDLICTWNRPVMPFQAIAIAINDTAYLLIAYFYLWRARKRERERNGKRGGDRRKKQFCVRYVQCKMHFISHISCHFRLQSFSMMVVVHCVLNFILIFFFVFISNSCWILREKAKERKKSGHTHISLSARLWLNWNCMWWPTSEYWNYMSFFLFHVQCAQCICFVSTDRPHSQCSRSSILCNHQEIDLSAQQRAWMTRRRTYVYYWGKKSMTLLCLVTSIGTAAIWQQQQQNYRGNPPRLT